MEIGAILLLLALLVPIVLYVVQPFGRGETLNPDTAGEHELSALLAERERVIASLQELDFDHALGKIAPEDYSAQRTALLKRGADVLRRLDALTASAEGKSASDADVEARLEEAIAARRAKTTAQGRSLTDDDLEALIAARRSARRDRSAGFCPHCGKAVLASDRFCPSCGKALAQ